MSWQEEREARKQIVEVHRKLYALGFSVANDGNTSVRLAKDKILITPSGLDKSRLEPQQMTLVDASGTRRSGNYPPSSEIAVHVAIYRSRPDVHAIVHAHPPYCIACSLAGVQLDQHFLPEVILALGTIPTAPYVTPTAEEAGNLVADLIKTHDAIILDRHGTVTVGKTLDEAMLKLERIEHTAKITAIAKAIGNVTPLPKPEVDRLLRMAGLAAPTLPAPEARTALIDLITREVLSHLKKQNDKVPPS